MVCANELLQFILSIEVIYVIGCAASACRDDNVIMHVICISGGMLLNAHQSIAENQISEELERLRILHLPGPGANCIYTRLSVEIYTYA